MQFHRAKQKVNAADPLVYSHSEIDDKMSQQFKQDCIHNKPIPQGTKIKAVLGMLLLGKPKGGGQSY